MRHDYKSFSVGFGEVLVWGLWQNHGTSPGESHPAPSPLSSNLPGFLLWYCNLLISPPHSLLIRPQGLMELSGYGSEETPTLLRVSRGGYVA